jgi:hypothetical protein
MDNPIDTPKKKRGAPVGHGRYGGRQKGSISRDTAAILAQSSAMGADPLEALLAVIGCDGAMRIPQINPATGKQAFDEWGELLYTWVAVSLSEKIQCCKSVMGYLFPRLQSTRISGADGVGPVEVATLDVTQIILDGDMAKAAQQLALMVAEQRADTDGAPSAPAVPYDASLVPIQRTRHE